MESRVLVACPSCQAPYRVRRSVLGQSAKCPKCGHTFALVVPKQHNEDEILTWLDEAGGGPTEALNGTVAGLEIEVPPVEEPATEAAAPPPEPKERSDNLHLDRIDPMGAYFWFPADALEDVEFRASFPWMCANCLTKENLRVHLIQWPSKLRPNTVFGARQAPAPAVYRLDELPDTDQVGLLNHLPRQENLLYPFSLPFPYYVCSHCSPSGLIHANTSTTAEGSRCWLSVSNLEIASRFYAANRGTEDENHHKLIVESELARKSHWDALPLAVRNRLSKWYKPHETEQFIDYLPDEDFAKAESGQAGIVVTDRRLVYHKHQTWREYPLHEALTIKTRSTSRSTRVELFSMAHGKAVAKLDTKSWTDLNRYLKELKGSVIRVD